MQTPLFLHPGATTQEDKGRGPPIRHPRNSVSRMADPGVLGAACQEAGDHSLAQGEFSEAGRIGPSPLPTSCLRSAQLLEEPVLRGNRQGQYKVISPPLLSIATADSPTPPHQAHLRPLSGRLEASPLPRFLPFFQSRNV